MNANQIIRINDAIAETGRKLAKALGYSPYLQKPAQIAFYQAHIEYLAALRDGRDAVAPVADRANWDAIRGA